MDPTRGECVYASGAKSSQTKDRFSVITLMKEIKSTEMIKLDDYIKLIIFFILGMCGGVGLSFASATPPMHSLTA